VHTINVSSDTIRCIAISPDEKQVAFGCRDNKVRVYDLFDYSFVTALTDHTMSVFAAEYSPDHKLLITGGRDAQLKIWDTSEYSLSKNIAAHMFAINHILFHPTKPYFATASMDKSIKIWGADDLKLYKVISREKGYDSHFLSVNKLAWNGDNLISVSDDKKIIIWGIEF
jgi:WD40 repeat protein